jgi:hypothetical protein
MSGVIGDRKEDVANAMMDTGKEVMQRHQSRVQHGIRKKRNVLMAVQCGAGHELGSSSISVRAVRVHGQAKDRQCRSPYSSVLSSSKHQVPLLYEVTCRGNGGFRFSLR